MKSVFRIRNLALLAFVSTGLLTTSLQAGTVPQNLGYGLDKLVESHVSLKAQNAARKAGEPEIVGSYNGWATEVAAGYAADAISDAGTGRFLVDITLRGTVGVEQMQRQIERRFPGFTVTAVDKAYRGVGIIEGFTNIEDVAALSQLKGVRAVMLGLRPSVDRSAVPAEARTKPVLPEPVNNQVFTRLGTAFDQGVFQHRVDQISQVYNPSATQNLTGNGISVGALSDSYDTRTAGNDASTYVASFDLPGAPTNPVNTKPVVVLVDEPAAGTDEGRGMIENIYKMAPKARLAFCTGVNGEVAFANYIRAMAGITVNPAPFPNPPAGNPNGVFKADIIVDDISVGGEPFYGESIIGGAIDDATAVGVSYFSSAGNNIGINAYESALRIVPNGSGTTAATNSALAGTNINLAGVPTDLYAGGFHNFNPNPGQLDVAALWNMPGAPTSPGATEMQWDDPYDIRDPVLNQPPIYSSSGSITGSGQSVVFNGSSTPPLPQFTAGTGYVIQETATSGNFDGIVTITDPNGKVIVNQDTGTDEVVTLYAPISGQYTITVTAFSTTTGNFNLTVNTTAQAGVITTDLNLLVFRADTGAYLGANSLTTNNIANNRPVELGGSATVRAPSGQTQIQFVIARANIPTAPRLPTRVRVSTRGNGLGGIGPAEYFAYNAVTTKGHATAKGCNGTAAYSVFRPNQTEAFTSPGPATILFDRTGALLATPEIRLVPRVAAIDAANTSDFPLNGDSTGDLDGFPNFSGTSSAAPHAAGIAALILEKNGGPGTVTPAQMRTIMQTNVFPHDLDPSFASSTARATNGGKVTITISSDNDTNTSTGQNDPNSIVVSYVGPSNLTSLVFNPGGTGATGGAVTSGINGYYDNTPAAGQVTYFEQDVPGLVFRPVTKAFTIGNLSNLSTTDAIATFTNQAGVPAPAGDGFFTMTLTFPNGNFNGGKALRFTVGRGQLRNADVQTGAVGNTPGPGATAVAPRADLFGGGVFIPRIQTVTDGMTYSGTLQDGSTFTGTIKNRIGNGYSVTDGYGLINAEAAVNATLPP